MSRRQGMKTEPYPVSDRTRTGSQLNNKDGLLYYERRLEASGCRVIIGIDEAGRGPLAGPVVAAAAALRDFSFSNRIDDSKKLTPRQRDAAFLEITGKADYGIGIVNEQIIDSVNILEASKLAMQEALRDLLYRMSGGKKEPAHALVDGDMKIDLSVPHTCIVRGDSRSLSIACASIIAKVTRDRIMAIYDAVYPQYGFARHKGYPTGAHREAISRCGPSVIHRRSFAGV